MEAWAIFSSTWHNFFPYSFDFPVFFLKSWKFSKTTSRRAPSQSLKFSLETGIGLGKDLLRFPYTGFSLDQMGAWDPMYRIFFRSDGGPRFDSTPNVWLGGTWCCTSLMYTWPTWSIQTRPAPTSDSTGAVNGSPLELLKNSNSHIACGMWQPIPHGTTCMTEAQPIPIQRLHWRTQFFIPLH
jgi:hypothetical protein